MTLRQAWELLQERAEKKFPTAPLHSEGCEISGKTSPRIYVGWSLPQNTELVEEFKKHKANEKSKLHQMIEDVNRFMKMVHDIADNVAEEYGIDLAIDEDEDEDEEDFGMDASELINNLSGVIFYRIKYGDDLVHFFIEFTEGGEDDASSIAFEGMWFGYRIEDEEIEFKEFEAKIAEFKEKLMKIDKPKECEGEMKVIVTGDSITGTVR